MKFKVQRSKFNAAERSFPFVGSKLTALTRLAAVLAVVIFALPGLLTHADNRQSATLNLQPSSQRACTPPICSTTESHGLQITLTVTAPSFPLDSLAQTTITLRNLTKQSIGIVNSICTGQSTHTEVLNKRGTPYPWPLPTYPLPCPVPLPTPLGPGKTLSTQSVVYLLSGTLRADLTVNVSNSSFDYVDVTGKVLKLGVFSSEPEHATFAAQPGSDGAFTASIWPVPKNAGKLYYAEDEVCRGNQGGEIDGGLANAWQSTSSTSVSTDILGPSCRHEEWHLIAGWLGYPAAKLDFSATSS